MKLRVFHSSDGDSLRLSSSDGHHALIDGGRSSSFEAATWSSLKTMARQGQPVDLVVVTHIDADHIEGILRLVKWVVDWAVYDYQTTAGGNPSFEKPEVPRPPAIGKIWHNAWSDQMGDLAGPIQAVLGRVGEALRLDALDGLSADPRVESWIAAAARFAESIPQGVELRRLIDDQPIPRNDPFKDLVLLRDPPHVEPLGSVKLTVLGPARKHLQRLKDDWRKWIENIQPDVDGLEAQAVGDLRRASGIRPIDNQHAREINTFGSREFADFRAYQRIRATRLGQLLATRAGTIRFADPDSVTPPNRASITLLAEEAGRTCLLTGDAHEEEILEGLQAANRLDGGAFRCDVVKVQHHGSEHNLSTTFATKVIADDYVFCGDGNHGNPNPSVVKTIVDARLAADPSSFTLWFNCSPSRPTLNATRSKALDDAISYARRRARQRQEIDVKVLDDDRLYFDVRV